MVCDPNETDLNISISAVMLPQDAGANLESSVKSGASGESSIWCMLFKVHNLFYKNDLCLSLM